MYIFTFAIMGALMLFITNKILNISDDNSIGYTYSKRDSGIVIGLLIFGIILQILPLKGHKIFWVAVVFYAFIIFLVMIILAAAKRVTITKQRDELQKVFEVLEPVLPKGSELDMNNPPFKLGYEKTQINRITIQINPNTFKETVATNLCLSLNRYLDNYEWVNEFDYAARECAFVGTPLPPRVAKYKGSWLRPAESIPIGLSGLGEVVWNINSFKDEGRSCYIYEDGKIAQTVDTPSAPQALCVGSPLSLNTIIPTTTGYKTMKTIEINDEVFGYHNKPVKVLGKSEVFNNRTCYKLTLKSARNTIMQIIADEIHKFPILSIGNKYIEQECQNIVKGNFFSGLYLTAKSCSIS